MATESETRHGAGTERGSSGASSVVTTWLENLSEEQFAYLLLTPAFVLLAIIALWPLLTTMQMSLFADNLGAGRIGDFVAIQNYVELFTGQKDALMPSPFLPSDLSVEAFFNSALTVTLIFTVVAVTFETIIGFGQALVLDQEFPGRRWVRVAIIIPWAVPIVVQGMIFYLLFNPNIGLLVGDAQNPTFLQRIGVFSLTPLANAVDATMIVIVADIWKTSAFMALLILAGLQSIDRNLYDVARVSGASPWQRFRYITLPLVFPTVLIAMLFRTIQSMRVFGIIESTAGCTTVPSLSCLVVTTFNNNLIGTSAAVAVVTAGIIAIGVTVYIIGYAREEMV
ncbi:carbohydrate ABC transporter permease [Haloarchaeobius sp. HRN-SO-5]|uniref:carbohydrate ABC transporter permease n=1 Tax=Haloarchaeobius sp. HRN-SO-5 TaxID=3446118 RepID=UPI003EBDAD22